MSTDIIYVDNFCTNSQGYYLYKINNYVYNASSVGSILPIVGNASLCHNNVPLFLVNTRWSKIIGMIKSNDGSPILFQERLGSEEGPRIVELLPRQPVVTWVTLSNIKTNIDAPNYMGQDYQNGFAAVELQDVSPNVQRYFNALEGVQFHQGITDEVMDLIINLRSIPERLTNLQLEPQENIQQPSQSASSSPSPIDIQRLQSNTDYILLRDSHNTLIKQLYGLVPDNMPDHFIINNIRVNIVPFEFITRMLANKQVERYIIDPMLQPWAGPPQSQNRIFTIFGKNGITYIVKARYDQVTNQIFPPV